MGSIRKRGAVYWIRYYRNGRRYEESSHSKTEREALRLLRIKEGDIAKGLPVSPAIARLTFNDAAKDLIHDYKANGKTSLEDVDRRITLHLEPFFGGRRMVNITTADVNAFIVRRQTPELDEQGKVTKPGASAAEINRELAALKRMFNLALQAGKLLHKPYVPMLEERNVRRGFFEREEFEAVRQHLPAALQPVATFAYLTGWRIASEVLTLEWRHVDLQAGTVRLDPGTTKNREGRVLPFGDRLPELRDLLEEQRRRTKAVTQAKGLVVARVFHRNGKPISDMRGAWRAACEAAGCPQRIPHDFRRTAVRNLERAGVSRSVAMAITGHKTEAVYRRYAIVSESDIGAGLEKLAGLGAGTKQGQSAAGGKVRRIRTKR